MIDRIKVYHHFKAGLIAPSDRVALVERAIYDLVVHSTIDDSSRESSACWELKHCASTAQFARVLARKRDLPVDTCAVGLMLHDIASITSGKYRDHAHRGADQAVELLAQLDAFDETELDQVRRLVFHHSDKHVWSDDPFQEFGKDVDVLDCFLYEGAFDFYLANKTLTSFVGYLERAKRVWEELGLPADARFGLLDGHSDHWFEQLRVLGSESDLLAIAEMAGIQVDLVTSTPPFVVLHDRGGLVLFGARVRWMDHAQAVAKGQGPYPPHASSFLRTLFSAGTSNTTQRPAAATGCGELPGVLQPLFNVAQLEPRAIVVWPLVGIYEALSGERAQKRLAEFGITTTTKKGT